MGDRKTEKELWDAAINDPGGYEYDSPHFQRLRGMFVGAIQGARMAQNDLAPELVGHGAVPMAWYSRLSESVEELADATISGEIAEIRSSLVAIAAVCLAWTEDTYVTPRKEEK